jgi:hypothetical protein
VGRERRITYPQTLHHLGLVNTELLGVTTSELADSEGPSVKTGTESNGTLLGVDLDITESLVVVSGDDDVHGLDGTGERLVQVFLGDLEFQQRTVDLVDDTDRLDTLTKSLTQHSLGLDTHTGNTVDDDQGTVGDTERSSDLGREVDVTGGVDQVDQELVTLRLLLDVLDVLGIELGVQGDGSGLDGDTPVLLVLTSVCESGLSSLGGRDNTGTLNERVGKGGLSVID